MTNALGTDWSCRSDLSPIGELVSDKALVEQDLLHILQTPRGRLRRHPGRGIDVRAFVATGITKASLFAMESQARQEMILDNRVQSADAKATREVIGPAQERVRLRLFAKLVTGETLDFTLGISALTVEILAKQP